MPFTKQDLRQIEAKTQNFKQLGLTQGSHLGQIISKINTDLDFPLKLSASFPTPDSKINFSDSAILGPDGVTKVHPPIQGQIFTDLASLWIDFQAQTVSNTSDFEITWPTSNTVGYYRIAVFTLTTAGNILALFSSEAASEASLPDAGGFFIPSGISIGYAVLQCTHADGKFKTAGSASNIIENSNIFRFDWRAGGGIVAGEANTASNVGGGEGIFKQKTGVDLEFKTLVAGSNITLTPGTDSITISTPPGETNTASNVGTGAGVFKQKTGVDLEFKSLVASGSAVITPGTNSIEISTSYGEANTASNVGTGAGIFKQKTGVNLEFKTLTPVGNLVLTSSADAVTLSAINGEINTASNVGTGAGIFKQKTGVNLEFKTLVAGTNINLTFSANSVNIDTIIPPQENELGDIRVSYLNYLDFQSSRPDGINWVPMDGRSIAGSDLLNSGNASESVLIPDISSIPERILNSPMPAIGAWFGYSVAIDGDYMVIGSPSDDGSAGSLSLDGDVYIYKKDFGGVNNWGLIKTLTLPLGDFGFSVAISGSYIVVGAPYEGGSTNAIGGAGEAYVYKKDQGGVDNWGLIKTLNSSNEDTSDYFGSSVAISGNYIVVGAPQDDGSTDAISSAGEAYVFYKDQGGTDNWGLIKTLNSSNEDASDNFGWSVAIDDDYMVVGAYDDGGSTDAISSAGEAYVFKKNQGGPNNWGLIKTLNSSNEDTSDYFGSSVAIDGDYIVIGAYLDDGTADAISRAGEVYIFKKDQGGPDNWGLIKILNSPDEDIDDFFGNSVAIDGDYIVVGAYDDGGSTDAISRAGEVYIFKKNQGGPNNWGWIKTLNSPNESNTDRFGNSVAIDGEHIVIGAYLDDDISEGVPNAGEAYLFIKSNNILYLPTESNKYIKINN
jgi:hypothetical protein